MVKLPEVGAHVVLKWLDSAEAPGWSYTNAAPLLYPRTIVSRGTIVGRTPLGIVLGAHISEADSGDGERGYLSLIAIPNGCIVGCEALK